MTDKPRFKSAPLPENESERIEALKALRVLDTAPEPLFDDIVKLASRLCEVPIALVSLVDTNRQWFKACFGLDARETPRDHAFCAHAILGDEIFEIPDTFHDDRFSENPLVRGEPFIRFYAGAPLQGQNRIRYGTLCVIDTKPRELSASQREILLLLSRQVAAHLEARLERQQLYSSEHALSDLLEAIPDAIVACDAKGSLSQFNAIAREWHGTDPREQPPEQWAEHFDLFEPDGITPLATEHIPLLRAYQGELVHDEAIVIKAKGQAPRRVLCNGKQLRDPMGELLGAVVIMRDVTRSHQDTEALRDERRRLATILEGTQAGTWEWNVQTGETRFNERWAEIVGYTLDELAPVSIQTWLDLCHPDDLAESGAKLQAHFSGESPAYDFVARMRHKSGHWVWVHDRGRVYQWDEQGQALWMAGTHLDVTESKNRDVEIANAKAYLQTVVDASLDVAIIATDTDGVITVFNVGAERLLGYRSEELIGKYTPAVFHLGEEVLARGKELSQQEGQIIEGFDVFVHAARAGRTETRQWTYVRKDGSHRQVRLSVSSLRHSNNEVFGFLGMAIDITEQLAAEETARLNAERFSGAFNTAAQGMALVSLQGEWITVNPALCKMLGYDEAQLLRSTPEQVSHPDDLAVEQKQLRALLMGKCDNLHMEKRFLHRAGHVIWTMLSVSLVRDQHGAPLHFVAQVQDTSQQHIVEQRLRESEAQLKDLIESLPGVVLRSQVNDTWTLKYVSDAIEGLSGYPATLFLPPHSKGFAELIVEEDLPATFAAVAPERLAQQNDAYDLRYRILTANGDIKRVQERGRAVRDEWGKVREFIGFVWDVSAQHLAEEALNEQQQFLQTLFDHLADAIVVLRDDGTVVSHNHAANALLQLAGPPVVRNIFERLPNLEKQLRKRAHDSDAEPTSLMSRRAQLSAHLNDGEIPVELSLTQVARAGVMHWVAILRDLTEQKRIEQMKSEFVSTVSHELRTPLTSISGSLNLLVGGALGTVPESMQEMLQIAAQNSVRLNQLVNDLLDMDKLMAGKLVFHFERLRLQPQLDEAVRGISGYAEPRGIKIARQGHDMVMVNVDPLRLQQVLNNLLSNACKHSPDNATVTLQHRVFAEHVVIAIHDQGAGIPVEFKPYIFQKFSQAETGNARGSNGTGLGLAITRELVERMHGVIGFSSVQGQGATFWLRLPRADAPHTKQPMPLIELFASHSATAERLHHALRCAGYRVHSLALAGLSASASTDSDTLNAEPAHLQLILLQANELEPALPPATIPRLRIHDHVVAENPFMDSAVIWDGSALGMLALLERVHALLGQDERPKRLLHIEDDPQLAETIRVYTRALISADNAATLAEAHQRLREQHYDLVLLDLRLPDGDGVEIWQQLQVCQPSLPVMVMSAVGIPTELRQKAATVIDKSRFEIESLLQTLLRLLGKTSGEHR